MAALRTPGSGCAWDLEQTFSTIAPYTIEEAYEVADAIERGDMVDLVDELGDLLLQVVFHAQMAQEAGRFSFGDVVQAISAKMIRRHPHVFGGDGQMAADDVKLNWSRIKAEEKIARQRARALAGLPDDSPRGLLDGVSAGLPALARALKLQARAAEVGFDWKDARLVLAKIREEIDEVEAELDRNGGDALHEEVGDLLFAVANLARHLQVDPDAALRSANEKFRRRFRFIEEALAARGRTPAMSTLEELEDLWKLSKIREKNT